MNEDVRLLIRWVCDGDIRRAQWQALKVMDQGKTEKDRAFREDMRRKMELRRQLTMLPGDLKGLLVVEDSEKYPADKFLLRDKEWAVAEEALDIYRAAGRLALMGIPYLPAVILYGQSGCGKTELARYIAYKAGLPFVYVRFSNVVSSKLGETQTNIAKIFDYARENTCTLCFDEIDAIGMCRGMCDDVGEMSRVVIAIMQELDQMPNNAIIIGTTNRFDQLDPALARRFPIQYEVRPMTHGQAAEMACRFFEHAGIPCTFPPEGWYEELCPAGERVTASSVVKKCTNIAVKYVKEQEKHENGAHN